VLALLLEPIEKVMHTGFMAYINGDEAQRKSKVYKIFKNGSKILLQGLATAAKPEGMRWWCRFPKHFTQTNEECYACTNDQSIVYIA
jgi:hypothetical protein